MLFGAGTATVGRKVRAFSWEGPADAYLALYEPALALRRGEARPAEVG
jgi:hypothetical protein